MSQEPSPIGRRADAILRAVALTAGGLALAWMTGLSVFNVLIMRKALNAPIQGAEDILILMLVFIVAVSIPFGARGGAHIEIEMMEPYMSPRVSRLSLIGVKIMGALLLAIMAWRLWHSGAAAPKFGETTQQLLISFEPFYYLLALGVAAYALILVAEVIHLARDRALPRQSADDPADPKGGAQ
ncbi:MAG: TRAP transporter small permease [Pseudomonadota bacterium]